MAAKTFDLGLVMAGAISAGAYTAGVIDFLLLALDEWEAERGKMAGERNFPHHRVELKLLAGSSAGGMTAALAAARLARGPAAADLIRRSWVDDIDLARLLSASDVDGGGPVRSLLNGRAIRDIADAAVPPGASAAPLPAYVSDPLDIVLTVSNLRGIPYGTGVAGSAAVSRYEMLTHGDWFHFALGARTRNPWGPSAIPPGPVTLTPGAFDHANWALFRDVAVATGAFPIALPPQRLTRGGVDAYTALVRRLVTDGSGPPTWEPVEPAFPANFPPSYPFDAVDGGMVNNEPVDLARRALGLDLHDAAARKGEAAVILVDPFPNTGVFRPDWPPEGPSVFGTAALVVGALLNQARFQPEELARARDPDVDTQFLISPKRGGRDAAADPARWLDIACGCLGGFGGFLHRAFRDHDYRLGRRNCQRFLRERFTLSGKKWTNGRTGDPQPLAGLFGSWTPPKGDSAWADMRDENNQVIPGGEGVALPIIPLFGQAKVEQVMDAHPWPAQAFGSDEAEKLTARVAARLRALARGFGVPGWVIGLAGASASGWAADELVAVVLKDLRDHGLYPA